MATIVTRMDVPWAYLPTLAELTRQNMESPTVYKEFMDIKGSEVSPDKRGVTTGFVVGLGPLQNWGEVVPVPFDTPDPGRLKTTAYADFGLACAISRNAVEDDIYGLNETIGRDLPRSHQLFRDLMGARLLNNFFATTYYTDDSGFGGTARALGATNHSSVNGASRPNILATGTSLTYQSVLDLLVLGWNHKDEKGHPTPAWAEGESLVLMVSPADAPMAIKIKNSLKDPNNNSNATNVVNALANLRVVINPYLTGIGSGNYWFLIRANKGIWLVERRNPEISNYRDNATKAMVVDLTCREAIHVYNTWGIWGSGN